MTSEEYIAELQRHMHGMSEEEIADAIAYCREYFADAMNDEKAVADLGTPAKFAAQAKAEAVIRQTGSDTSTQKPQAMMRTIMMIAAGIFALPIALPLLFAALILLLVLVILIFTFILVGGVFVVACGYAAIASLLGVWFYAGGVGDTFCHLGAALLFLGAGILSWLGTKWTINKLLPYIIDRLSQFYHRHKARRKQNDCE